MMARSPISHASPTLKKSRTLSVQRQDIEGWSLLGSVATLRTAQCAQPDEPEPHDIASPSSPSERGEMLGSLETLTSAQSIQPDGPEQQNMADRLSRSGRENLLGSLVLLAIAIATRIFLLMIIAPILLILAAILIPMVVAVLFAASIGFAAVVPLYEDFTGKECGVYDFVHAATNCFIHTIHNLQWNWVFRATEAAFATVDPEGF